VAGVGVLALQGDFDAHARALRDLGVKAIEVNSAAALSSVAGLVIPGGESTTMLKLLDASGMWEPLAEFGRRSPIFGTCAGAILIARAVISPAQASFGLMDIEVERNAYGRQVHSRVARIGTELGEMEAVFIRAPIIRWTGPGVRVLAMYEGTPVLAEEGLHLVATFHPELSAARAVHQRFLDKVNCVAV
jgi:5'-phosphate synthase pdxT subunit